MLLALPNRGLDLLNDPVQMVEVAQRAASASYMNADANRADFVAEIRGLRAYIETLVAIVAPLEAAKI